MKFILAGLLLIIHLFSWGQNTCVLKGKVTDNLKTPVANAMVSLNNQKYNTITDSLGFFMFKQLPADNYLISVSSLAHKTFTNEISLRQDQFLNINLISAIYDLDEVIISENYENNRNKEEPITINVVGNDFVIENNSGNLVKTLGKLPGINSMDIGSGFSKPVIRGMGFNRIVVAENGIKQEGQQWGADHGLEIDQFGVEKIVISKGPMSLRYGCDAIGGLIEILPGKHFAKNSISADVTFIGNSNNGLLGVSAMIGFRKNKWEAKMRLTEKHFADYKIPADTIVYLTRRLPVYNRKLKNTAGYERNFLAVVKYTGHKAYSHFTGSRVTQKTGYFPGSHGVPDISRLTPDGSTRNIELPNSSVNHLKLVNSTQVDIKGWKAAFDVGFQMNHRQEMAKFHTHYGNQPVPASDPNPEIDLRLATYSGNFRLESGKDKKLTHSFGLNTDYQTNQIAGFQFLLPEFEKYTFGLFFVESWKVNNRLTISGGARTDLGRIKIQAYKDTILQNYLQDMAYNSKEINFYSHRSYALNKLYKNSTWSIGMVFNPDPWHTIKVNLGRSYRLPGVNELASNGIHHGTFRHEQGDSSLVSEKGLQTDLAYTYFTGKVSVSVNPFVSIFKNYIYLNPTGVWSVLPHAGQIYKFSQAKALAAGGEISVNVALSKRLNFDSNFEHVNLQNLTDGYPLPFSPPASVLNGIEWQLNRSGHLLKNSSIKLEHHLVFSQHRIARNEEETSGYQLFNLNINSDREFNGKRIKVAFQIQNIFNTKYFNHLSFYRKLNIPEPGRTFQATIKISV